MWQVLFVVFGLGLIQSAVGISVPFDDCGPLGSYAVEQLILDVPCKIRPCWLPMKRQTNMTVTFRSNNIPALDVKPVVHIILGGSPKLVEFAPLACPKYVCPIHPQEKKSYSLIIKPNLRTEPIPVTVSWEFFNQKHQLLFNIRFKVVIYDPEIDTPHKGFRSVAYNGQQPRILCDYPH